MPASGTQASQAGKPTAFVCKRGLCDPPKSDPAVLRGSSALCDDRPRGPDGWHEFRNPHISNGCASPDLSRTGDCFACSARFAGIHDAGSETGMNHSPVFSGTHASMCRPGDRCMTDGTNLEGDHFSSAAVARKGDSMFGGETHWLVPVVSVLGGILFIAVVAYAAWEHRGTRSKTDRPRRFAWRSRDRPWWRVRHPFIFVPSQRRPRRLSAASVKPCAGSRWTSVMGAWWRCVRIPVTSPPKASPA